MCHCADTCREPGHYKPRCPRLRGDGLARVPCVSGAYGGPLRVPVCAAAWHRQCSAGGDRVSASTSAGERVSAVPRGQRPAVTCHALEHHVRARVQVGRVREHDRNCQSGGSSTAASFNSPWSPLRQPTPRASRKFNSPCKPDPWSCEQATAVVRVVHVVRGHRRQTH